MADNVKFYRQPNDPDSMTFEATFYDNGKSISIRLKGAKNSRIINKKQFEVWQKDKRVEEVKIG